MTLQEIKTRICDLRCSVEELAEECHTLWTVSEDNRTEKVADVLQDELTMIASDLASLEDTEEEDETNWWDTEHLTEWWGGLDLREQCDLANIPYPHDDSGRYEEQFECELHLRKWWESRTAKHKAEVYQRYCESH